MTVEALRAQLHSDPVLTENMTSAEIDAEFSRWNAECRARDERLDEEHLLTGIGRSAAVCMTHELIFQWQTATADRWFRALPERYMTPDSMTRPDWNHSHYPHDEQGRIGRVTTLQRPETEADREAARMVAAILADLAEQESAS